MNEYIFRFDIAMHHMSIVEYLISFGKLDHNVPDLFLWHEGCFCDVLIKRTLVTILHDDVEVVLALNVGFDAVDKVIVSWQFSQHLELGFD